MMTCNLIFKFFLNKNPKGNAKMAEVCIRNAIIIKKYIFCNCFYMQIYKNKIQLILQDLALLNER